MNEKPASKKEISRYKQVSKLKHECLYSADGISSIARAKAWPLLLDISQDSLTTLPSDSLAKTNRYADIISCDVDRSMWSFCPDAQQRTAARAKLQRVLNALFYLHPEVHYYQGLHSLVAVILLNCNGDEQLTLTIVEKLAAFHLRDYVQERLDLVIEQLGLILHIIQQVSKRVGRRTPTTSLARKVKWCREKFEESVALEGQAASVFNLITRSSTSPYFALAWVITWFSHNLNSLSVATRLFDFFLVSHPLMPIYYSVAVILHSIKDGLLNTPEEMPLVHSFLSKYVDNYKVDHVTLIWVAQRYYELVPPEMLLHKLLSSKMLQKSIVVDWPYKWMVRNGLVRPRRRLRDILKLRAWFMRSALALLVLFFSILFYFIVALVVNEPSATTMYIGPYVSEQTLEQILHLRSALHQNSLIDQ